MINSFKTYLVEEEKTVYFTFGRMNPPTIGHEKLLNTLATKSGNNPYRAYLSQSTDKNKNPLAYKDKVKFVRKMFPRHARSVMMNPRIKTFMDAAVALYNEGFKNVVMVVGEDRVNEFDVLLNKYNGKKMRNGFYNFARINVVSAGDRDPDGDDASSASATKQRQAAKTNDFTAFGQGLPRGMSNADAKALFNAVRSGMGLKETKDFTHHVKLDTVSETREQYVQGDLFQVGDRVVVIADDTIATVTHLGSNYVIVEQEGLQMRKWLNAVELLEKRQPQDPDVSKVKGTQPKPYYKGLDKDTKQARAAHFRAYANKSPAEKDAAPYKKAPGDATAKTKPSKYTLKFKQMYGENSAVDLAKKRIDQEKAADAKRHDRMMDKARLKDTQATNKATK
jgi:type IV secretory pathway TrbD component